MSDAWKLRLALLGWAAGAATTGLLSARATLTLLGRPAPVSPRS